MYFGGNGMSFWQSELGEVSGNPDEAFAKSFRIVPNDTMALARIESFINAEHNGSKYMNIEWILTDGEFKGQKVNQKIKAFDSDPKIRHRALNMLKLLYMLFDIKPKSSNPPTDQELAAFVNKAAGIKIRETEPNEEGKQYNWVSEVHEAKGFVCETGIKLVVNSKSHESQNATYYGDPRFANGTEDIPF